MIQKSIKNELVMLLPRVLILDAAIYGVSLIFLGLNYTMLLGLLLGTAVLYLYLFLLAWFTEETVLRYKISGSEKSAKGFMFLGYLLRYFVVGAAIYISFTVKFGFLFNTFGVVIPLVYPKLIYYIQSISKPKRKGERK